MIGWEYTHSFNDLILAFWAGFWSFPIVLFWPNTSYTPILFFFSWTIRFQGGYPFYFLFDKRQCLLIDEDESKQGRIFGFFHLKRKKRPRPIEARLAAYQTRTETRYLCNYMSRKWDLMRFNWAFAGMDGWVEGWRFDMEMN
jgi:hypothetical protein